ncbi:MAG: glycosyltransferase family 2 protein, partial [Hyphomicrobiales bacterium]
MNPNPSPGHQGDLPAKVQVVIVNWNSGVWLGKSVGSIARFGGANVDRVVVVDNASADGSADVIAPGIDLRIIQTGANLGFGKACNLGAAGATAPYLLFLNPDAMLQPGSLADVLRFMESPEAAGVGVCGIRLVGEAGEVQHHTTNQPTPWTLFNLALLRTRFDHLQSRTVGHVIGAFYLIRREVFEAVGGFDERFFVYLEDLDLSVRVAATGWKIHYLAEASAFHKGGGTSEQVKAHRLFYSMQSRIL